MRWVGVLPDLAILLFGVRGRAAEDLPRMTLDGSAADWVVHRFAGNSTAGPQFLQGPAREVGGLYGCGACARPDGKLENQEAVKEPSCVRSRLACWLDFGREKKPGATWPWGPSARVWDGEHSVVVWQRHHLAGEKLTNFANCDLIAARVDGFTSLDEAGIPVAASDAEETRPALASDGSGRLLCVYEKRSDGRICIAARVLKTR